MTITLRACRRCGGDTNERKDIQAGLIITCIQCGDVDYPGYVIETDEAGRNGGVHGAGLRERGRAPCREDMLHAQVAPRQGLLPGQP